MKQQNNEILGLEKMRSLTEGFLQRSNEEPLIKQFLEEVDDETMLHFLRGRKYRPSHAWETLKRYAEVKFVKYPEFFPQELPPSTASLREGYLFPILKHRDSQGRRILIFDSAYWNADEHSLTDITAFSVPLIEKIIRDRDAVENGLIIILQCDNFGLKHCLQYSVKALKKLMNVFWYAYPVRYKAVYYVNTPYMLSCTLSLAKLFFPKKLKERLHISTDDGALHEAFSPDILPKCVGGKLEIEEAVDPEMAVD